MEGDAFHPSRSASTQTKRMGMGEHVKAYLEGWYESMGKPKALTLAEKKSILHHIQSELEPAGISLYQLKKWFSWRRRAEKSPGTSPAALRRKRFSMSILFPTLTTTELDHLKTLLEENPNPSPDLLTVWVDSPLLPNVTFEDARRFVKYNLAQMQSDNNTKQLSSASRYPLNQDDAMGDADESDEEDMLDDQSYLLTPESTSPELNPRIIKPEPSLSPPFHLPSDDQSRGVASLSSVAPTQLPHDPHVLLELLRSQLSTDQLKQLLHEGRSGVTSVSPTPTSPSIEPIVSNHLPSPESQPISPVSPLLHKSSRSFVHTHPSSPGEVAVVSSDSTNKQARIVSANSSSHETHMPYPPKIPTTSPGFIPIKILRDISKLFFEAPGNDNSPENFIKRFELCQHKSEELIAALERGRLKEFGILPSEELKALGIPGLAELPSQSHDALP